MTSSYKTAGDKKGGGDPNVMTLKDTNKVRPLDDIVAEWKQHGIEHPSDPEKFQSVVCPGPRSCPLDRKPVSPDNKAYFPVSRRFAANIWDYESNSVKVLIAGPQVFDEFKKAATVGIEPSSCDWTIVKIGSGINTKYEVIRHDGAPFAFADKVKPEDLHDVAKYEAVDSPESIFEKLESYGIDYDSLEVPVYTTEEALAFIMPYTKHKGLTVDQLLAADEDFALFLHRSKLEQGQLGDPVFLALQGGLEDHELVPPLDDALAELPEPETPDPTPATAVAKATTPVELSPASASMVELVSPDGETIHVPSAAAGSLRAAGYTDPKPPEPEGDHLVLVEVAGGQKVEVMASVAAVMVAGGAGQIVEPEAPEPDPDTPITVMINGTAAAAELPYATAKALVDSGAATFELVGPAEPEPEPQLTVPLPDEEVQISMPNVPIDMPMAYVTAAQLVDAGQATFVDDQVAKAHEQSNAKLAVNKAADAAQVAAEGTQANSASDPERPFQCGDCGKNYKTQGALTQHKNKEHSGDQPQPSAVPPPAAQNGGGDLAEQIKAKITASPLVKDFTKLMQLMEDATGEKNFNNMNQEQLQKLDVALDEFAAAS